MPGFVLTNSIQLSQVSALVNLTDISLLFGMVYCIQMFRKRDQNNKNAVLGEFRLCTGVKISA